MTGLQESVDTYDYSIAKFSVSPDKTWYAVGTSLLKESNRCLVYYDCIKKTTLVLVLVLVFSRKGDTVA